MNNDDTVKITLIKAKNYSDFWSFLYSPNKYADWEKIPSLGYSGYRTFTSIGNYLVLSPEHQNSPTPEMIKYSAMSAILTRHIGLDGISQIYTHNPGYLEEYFVRTLNKAN